MTLLRMLRAFTRDSQEKNNTYPTVDSQFSDVHSSVDIIPRVTNIRKTMSIKPSSSRSVGQEPPEAEHNMASGAGSTCVWPGDPGLWGRRVAEAGEDICSSSRCRVLGQSQSPPWTHLMRRGPGGEAMKIKPPMFIASSHIGADVGS